MNLLTIQLVDDTRNSQPGSASGQVGQAGQSPSAESYRPSAESYRASQPPTPTLRPVGGGVEDLAKQILATPGAKQFGFTPSVLAGMSPEAVEDLAQKLGLAGPRPTTATAPPIPTAGGTTRATPAPAGQPVGSPAASRSEPETYGFADPNDRLKHGPRYDVLPPEAPPKHQQVRYTPGMEPPPMTGVPANRLPGTPPVPRAEPVAPPVPKAGGGGVGGGGLGVAGALVAAELAAEMVAKTFDKLGEAATTAGRVAQHLAGNRSLGALTTAVDGAASAMGGIPIVGQVFESGLRSATATVRAFAGTVEAFTNRGREPSAYSAKLAESNARQDLARMQADIREAQELGPTLAALTDKVTELENMGREALLPIKEIIAGFLVEALTVVRDAAVGFIKFLETSSMIPQAISDWAKKVLDALKAAKDPKNILDAWLSAADALGPGVFAPDPAAQAAAAKLAAPIFAPGM